MDSIVHMPFDDVAARVRMPTKDDVGLLTPKSSASGTITLTPETYAIVEDYTLDADLHAVLAKGGDAAKKVRPERRHIMLALDLKNNLLQALVPCFKDGEVLPGAFRQLSKEVMNKAYKRTPQRAETAMANANQETLPDGTRRFIFPSALVTPGADVRRPRGTSKGAAALAGSSAAMAAALAKPRGPANKTQAVAMVTKLVHHMAGAVASVSEAVLADCRAGRESAVPGALCGAIFAGLDADTSVLSAKATMTQRTEVPAAWQVFDLVNQFAAGASPSYAGKYSVPVSSADSQIETFVDRPAPSSEPESTPPPMPKTPAAAKSSSRPANDGLSHVVRGHMEDTSAMLDNTLMRQTLVGDKAGAKEAPLMVAAGRSMAAKMADPASREKFLGFLGKVKTDGFSFLPQSQIDYADAFTLRQAMFDQFDQETPKPIVSSVAAVLGMQFLASYMEHTGSAALDTDAERIAERSVRPLIADTDVATAAAAEAKAALEALESSHKKEVAALKRQLDEAKNTNADTVTRLEKELSTIRESLDNKKKRKNEEKDAEARKRKAAEEEAAAAAKKAEDDAAAAAAKKAEEEAAAAAEAIKQVAEAKKRKDDSKKNADALDSGDWF